MNKSDFKLIIITIIFSLLFLLIIKSFNNDSNKQALVYYDNDLIKNINLSINETKEYIVNGYNGDIVIETKKGMIRVKEENSPLHICSKQGWVSSTYEIIVCLPNKVVIKIVADEETIDTVVR